MNFSNVRDASEFLIESVVNWLRKRVAERIFEELANE